MIRTAIRVDRELDPGARVTRRRTIASIGLRSVRLTKNPDVWARDNYLLVECAGKDKIYLLIEAQCPAARKLAGLTGLEVSSIAADKLGCFPPGPTVIAPEGGLLKANTGSARKLATTS